MQLAPAGSSKTSSRHLFGLEVDDAAPSASSSVMAGLSNGKGKAKAVEAADPDSDFEDQISAAIKNSARASSAAGGSASAATSAKPVKRKKVKVSPCLALRARLQS